MFADVHEIKNIIYMTKYLTDFIETFKTKRLGEKSWILDIEEINIKTWDLTVSNPNIVEETDHRTPQEIIAEIEQLDEQAVEALQKIKELL